MVEVVRQKRAILLKDNIFLRDRATETSMDGPDRKNIIDYLEERLRLLLRN